MHVVKQVPHVLGLFDLRGKLGAIVFVEILELLKVAAFWVVTIFIIQHLLGNFYILRCT